MKRMLQLYSEVVQIHAFFFSNLKTSMRILEELVSEKNQDQRIKETGFNLSKPLHLLCTKFIRGSLSSDLLTHIYMEITQPKFEGRKQVKPWWGNKDPMCHMAWSKRKHEQLDRLLGHWGSPSLTVLGNHMVTTMKISLGRVCWMRRSCGAEMSCLDEALPRPRPQAAPQLTTEVQGSPDLSCPAILQNRELSAWFLS